MSIPAPISSVPTSVGTEEILADVDVLDEHHLRRRRLDAALRRGSTAPSGAEPTWRMFLAAVLLVVVALGGTAVAATVATHLPARGASAEQRTDEPASPSQVSPTPVSPPQASTTPVFEPGRPYGTSQTASQTTP